VAPLDAFLGAGVLSMGTANSPGAFIGDFAASLSLEDRQLTIQNTTTNDGGFPAPMSGLIVSRRLHVPATGDFLRYLDVLENPTSSPVTVELVRVQGHFAGLSPRLVATSSGDLVPTAADQWVIGNDAAAPARPSGAIVFHGDGAPRPPDNVSIDPFFSDGRRPFFEWRNLTVPAGGRVILMHFAVQQVDASSAIAAAERLAQAPSEAIADLSAEDRAAIVNFAVPPPIAMAPGPAGGAGTNAGASTGANLRIPD
jgi:hypothetical protein